MKRKNYAYIVIVVCIMLSFLSCEKDKEMELSTLSVTNEELVASYTSVSVSCQIKSESTLRNVYLHYATSDDFVEYKEVQMKKEKKGYSAQVSDLLDNTTYYVRYSASNSYSSIIGTDISRFTTLAASLPSIQLDSVFAIVDTCAKARVTLKADGNTPILEMGVCWDVEQEPTYEHNRNAMNEGVPNVSVISLNPNTKYYVRAYAKNKVGIAYSESVSFFTLDLPKVQTNDITNIQLTTALLNGSLIFNGNDTATVKGFCWSENPQPTISNDYSQVTTNGNEFSYQLSNLKDETKYYVRTYAKNKIGVAYGEEKSFITSSALQPSITTSSSVSNISYTSATVGGNVTSDGGATVTERGVVYSTTPNPTTSSSTKVASGTGTGSFTCSLENLQAGTTYYVRAYAINKKGTSYGEQREFTTVKFIAYFSVSSTKKVMFSSGNLQYHPFNKKWRFAPSQLDYIGGANSKISSTYNGWIDLYGWGTGDNSTNSSCDVSNYQSFVDWGTNQIGSDAHNTWRTLTKDEWDYLLNTRPNAKQLLGIAQVDGVNGLILLPDNWMCPTGITFKSGCHSSYGSQYYANYQTFTVDQWSTLEAAGAVFLPAAGSRLCDGDVAFGWDGLYWSSTPNYSNFACCLYFNSSEVSMVFTNRDLGISVRLVQNL